MIEEGTAWELQEARAREPALGWSGPCLGGACPGRRGSGSPGVGVEDRAREPVRGMWFRLAKLLVRQSVAFREEKRGRLTWGPPERWGGPGTAARHRADDRRTRVGQRVFLNTREVYSFFFFF